MASVLLAYPVAASIPDQTVSDTYVGPEFARGPDAQTLMECYPAASRLFGEEASLQVIVQVLEDGRARVVSVPKGTSDSMRTAAECVVGQLRFRPATLGGTPVPATAVLPLNFRLDDSDSPPFQDGDDAAAWLAQMLMNEGLRSHAVYLAGQMAAGSPVAQRLMREDPVWPGHLVAYLEANLRLNYTPDELRRVAQFFSSPVGLRWRKTRVDAMLESITGEARRQVAISACTAAVLSVKAETTVAAHTKSSSSDDRLVTRMPTGIEAATRKGCECAIEYISGDNVQGEARPVTPSPDAPALQALGQIMDGKTCPRPEGVF